MDKLRAAFISLLAGILVAVLKTLAWTQSLSVAVLADALHSAVDLLAVAITYIAVRVSLKPPDLEHPYGHHKAETLGGVGGSLAVIASVFFVAYEAVKKAISWEPYVPTPLSMAILASAILIDYNRVTVLRRFRGVSRALEADALHFATDLASTSALLTFLVFGYVAMEYMPQLFTQWGPLVDIMLAAVIATYFVTLSLRLLRTTVMELMDYAPPEVAKRALSKVSQIGGVDSVKSIKIRKAGSIYHAEVVIAIDENLTVREAHEIADRVEDVLKRELGGEVTVHVEPSTQKEKS
ncbi:MAG: cation diffusion facilitator family transporter [Pyrobaculum sp.]